MSSQDEMDDVTQELRQSVIETKGRRQKEKYCVRDFSGEIFELTSDMLVNNGNYDTGEKKEFVEVAECILNKYAKRLSMTK